MPEKRTLHLFLKITFFFLHSFSLTLKHFLIIFSGKQTTKNGQKSSLKGKKIFFFFKFISHFPSPITEKNKTTYFFRPFITGNRRTGRENVPLKIFLFFFFFFLLFCILPLRVIEKITTYLFFSKFRLKVPKTAAKRAQVSFFTNYHFSAVITRTHTPTDTHSVFPTDNA